MTFLARFNTPCLRNALFFIPWALALIIGFTHLLVYSSEPGQTLTPSLRWPAQSTLVRANSQPTLVLVAHPQCPCTRATMTELNILMSELHGKLKAYVLFYKPSGYSVDWEKTALWKKAARIPGITLITDTDGGEARHFHATISGQAFLYAPDGHLVFTGGITPSRGHEGDNAGLDTIISDVNHQSAARKSTFAFGCPIFELPTFSDQSTGGHA